MLEKEEILNEIKIPDSIFYEKYSILHIDIGRKKYIGNNFFKNLMNGEQLSVIKNAIDYRNFQEKKFDNFFSWNEIKKIYTLEKYQYQFIHKIEEDLLSDINNEIAKEEIEMFLKNIKTVFKIEKKYLTQYIKHVEYMFLYNLIFKNKFLDNLENLIIINNKEISFIIRFFEKKQAVNEIYNYIFQKNNGGLFSNNLKTKKIATVLFILNMNKLDEKEKEFFINNCLLTDDEKKLIDNEVEILEDKEAEYD